MADGGPQGAYLRLALPRLVGDPRARGRGRRRHRLEEAARPARPPAPAQARADAPRPARRPAAAPARPRPRDPRQDAPQGVPPPVIDDGIAVHYSELTRGTPVFSADEVQVGTGDEVRGIDREHILDGIVVKTTAGERRFVDAPEVARTAERAVTLTIPASEVDNQPPEPSRLAPTRLAPTGLARLFRRRR